MSEFDNWVSSAALGGGALGGIFWLISMLRRAWSRNNLDTTQFDGLSATINLMRQELERERKERARERKESNETEVALKREIQRLTEELEKTRAEVEKMRELMQRIVSN